jgi:hypothetical protein
LGAFFVELHRPSAKAKRDERHRADRQFQGFNVKAFCIQAFYIKAFYIKAFYVKAFYIKAWPQHDQRGDQPDSVGCRLVCSL